MYIQTLDMSDTIHLHPNIINKYNIISKRLIVQFGVLKHELKVVANDKLSEESIGLPLEFFARVTIPKNIPFDIVMENRVLRIGPVIAFIPTANKRKLTHKTLNSYKNRLVNYDSIRGLFFVAASNSINTKTHTINGYYYNPNGRGPSEWVKGTFPYPNVIYNRVRLRRRLYDSLVSVMGDRIFNSYLFNKEELMEYLSTESTIKDLLPYTERYKSYDQLVTFLDRFNVVYLKPADGSHGRGIFQIEKINDQQLSLKNQNQVKILNNNMETEHTIKNIIQNKSYLIQQGVPTKHNGHHIDFRAYMQKVNSGQWEVQGFVARKAKKGSIVTNLAYVEKLLMGKEALEQLVTIDKSKVTSLEELVKQQCCAACQAIDTYFGHYGDVAIDFIIDKDLRIWVLEINKAYTCKSLKILKEYQLYQKLMVTPIEYAKYLAGF
ncbi:YheC/YheD family endospore coat-associated protein [Bacillus sp. Marseille-P3661]|uniref:YheC/YheD family endospore coat-associated protein n=1 Tax=Bacillus sp. Marseille-P3661 TaxID=1936234 RepID=UPI000C8571E0|nr:YheC/YheD family protein [Bacillus sp. Marseille-P3661]